MLDSEREIMEALQSGFCRYGEIYLPKDRLAYPSKFRKKANKADKRTGKNYELCRFSKRSFCKYDS